MNPYQKLFGVSRGSVLGPLSFLLFINNIGRTNSDIMLLFADDTVFGLKSCFERMIKSRQLCDI